jgi:predicted CXXCH cytochrome family protein
VVALFLVAAPAWAQAPEGPAANADTPGLISYILKSRTGRPISLQAALSNAPKPAAPDPSNATNDFCLYCHGNSAVTMTFPNGESLSLFVDQEAFALSAHGLNHMPCIACHAQYRKYPHLQVTAASPRELSRRIVQESCFHCHQTIYQQFKESVHGKALVEEGNPDVPDCSDCHGIHSIRDPHSALFRAKSPEVCSRCHSDRALAARYGMSDNVTRSYFRDFHGMSIRLASETSPGVTSAKAATKAVCYDCHGSHDIRRVSSLESSVIQVRLVETCRQCHPGAHATFTAAWMNHFTPDRQHWPLVYWVNVAYKILIPSIIGLIVLYVLLDLIRAIVGRIRRGQGQMNQQHSSKEHSLTYVRLTVPRRVEHAVLMCTFSALAITGISQKYNSLPAAEAVLRLLGGIDRVRLIHHTFAVILILEAFYHAVTVAHSALIRRQEASMRLSLRDLRDAVQTLRYFTGLRADRAQFPRFDFRQKLEYWALICGTLLMITTGLIMWFPVRASSVLPGAFIPAAKAAHGGEALLAFLCILLGHMYSAHLRPEVFPVDTSIFDGRISEQRMRREHPLEYNQIVAQRLSKPASDQLRS